MSFKIINNKYIYTYKSIYILYSTIIKKCILLLLFKYLKNFFNILSKQKGKKKLLLYKNGFKNLK